jgi:hypothetical protein
MSTVAPLLSGFLVDCSDENLTEAELLETCHGRDDLQRIRCISQDVTSIAGSRATTLTRVHQETVDDN